MDILQESIEVYERLRNQCYHVAVENGEEFTFKFLPENYHHLAGFQHLIDFQNISDYQKKDQFYGRVKRKQIDANYVQRSSYYHTIAERLNTFATIERIVSEGAGKIIVEYDKTKLSSEIDAKYYLYDRYGSTLMGSVTYHILFIGCRRNSYFPATYVVEHSNIYIREQALLNCKITHLPK